MSQQERTDTRPANRNAEKQVRDVDMLKQVRSHADEVEAEKSEALNTSSDWLKKHIERANDNLLAVASRSPNAATSGKVSVLDALLFHQLSIYSTRQARGLSSSLKCYTPKSFVDALRAAMRSEDAGAELSFRNFPKVPYRSFRTVPVLDFMRGVIDATEQPVGPKKKERCVVHVTKGANAVQPKAVEQGDVAANRLRLQLGNMRAALQRLRSCELWRFVLHPDIHPNSFDRSCDNIWYLMNLIKDKHARLDVNQDPPMVYFRMPEEVGGREKPFVFDFNFDVYQMLIKRHNIKEYAFPPLENEAPPTQSNGLGSP